MSVGRMYQKPSQVSSARDRTSSGTRGTSGQLPKRHAREDGGDRGRVRRGGGGGWGTHRPSHEKPEIGPRLHLLFWARAIPRHTIPPHTRYHHLYDTTTYTIPHVLMSLAVLEKTLFQAVAQKRSSARMIPFVRHSLVRTRVSAPASTAASSFYSMPRGQLS